jgi:hypothetical protein
MSKNDGGKTIKEDRRRTRLAASLRENLKRRKVQHRSRANNAPPVRDKQGPASRDPKG